ncbi:hypothetical protein BJY00DRAFT_326357 [Aspergillus carlsbadensis]|nr:hypothetical protein BJY00DRAFT_326357 [Aspergillus carlsbadensis]
MASSAPRRVVTDKPTSKARPPRPPAPGSGTLSHAKEKIHKFMEQRANQTREAADAASTPGKAPVDKVQQGTRSIGVGDAPDNVGDVAEQAENIPSKEQPDLSVLDGLEVQDGGKIFDRDGNLIGEVAEGNPEDLVGQTVNAEGEIVDEDGDLIGVVSLVQQVPDSEARGGMEIPGAEKGLDGQEGVPQADMGEAEDEAGGIDLPPGGDEAGDVTQEEAPEAGEDMAEALPDISTLEGLKCNKLGSIVTADGTPVGELVEGNAKKLAREESQLDAQGQFWDNQGHVIGKAKVVPVEEDEQGPFAEAGDIYVAEDGWVKDEGGRQVGKLVEGDAKKLIGRAVDDDGDILDKRGNVIGRAEPCEPPEEEENEQAEKDEAEEEDFSALEGLIVNKLGNILDNSGVMVGRVAEGNPKKLAGKKVDSNGQIWSDAGKVIGQAELIPVDEREKPEGAFYGFEGLTVGDEGTVVDLSGEVIGRLTEGDGERLKGRAVDEDGEIIDKLGNVIGRAERWTPEEKPEPELSPEELEKQRKEKEDEDLAKKMSSIVQQTLDSVGPLCRQITQHIEKANQTPKDELDEEELVRQVKPLIEEAGNALQECKGALRALDPDGHIAETAKARSGTHDATPAEQHLADLLKELTQTVVETIDNGRRLIADMPHAKKELNPLWALLSEPLFQIIAAVGLLLTGVIGLVSRLLDGLGLGGLLRGLLGGLGLDKLLEGFGLGTVTEALGIEGKLSSRAIFVSFILAIFLLLHVVFLDLYGYETVNSELETII